MLPGLITNFFEFLRKFAIEFATYTSVFISVENLIKSLLLKSTLEFIRNVE